MGVCCGICHLRAEPSAQLTAASVSVRSYLAAAPRCGWRLAPAPGRGAGRPPGARRAYLPRHQRFSSASQWLNHVPFALLRRSMATWWRAHQPSGLAGGVGSGRLAGGSGLVLAGGSLSGQGLLHRLLDEGLHVGGGLAGGTGGGGGGSAACPATAASRCWRRVSSWRCRSRAWSRLGRRKARYLVARFLTPPV